MKFVDMNFFNQIGGRRKSNASGALVLLGIVAVVLALITWTIIIIVRASELTSGISKNCIKGEIGNNMKHDNYISNKEEISKAWGKMFFFNSKWNKLAIDMIKNGKDKKGKYVSDKVKNILNKSEHKGLLFPCY